MAKINIPKYGIKSVDPLMASYAQQGADELQLSPALVAPTTPVTQDPEAQYIKAYEDVLAQQPEKPASVTSIKDIAGGVGEKWGSGDYLGSIGTGLEKTLDYLQTPQGMRVLGMVGDKDVYERGAYQGMAKAGEAQQALTQKAYDEALEKQKERIATAGKEALTRRGELGKITTTGEEARKTQEAKGVIDKEAELIKNQFTSKQNALDRASTEKIGALRAQVDLDLAGITDDRERQVKQTEAFNKAHEIIQKDADAIDKISKFKSAEDREKYVQSRLNKELPELAEKGTGWFSMTPRTVVGGGKAPAKLAGTSTQTTRRKYGRRYI